MLVVAKDAQGKFFQFTQHGSSLSAVAVIAEEGIKSRADADKLIALTIIDPRWPKVNGDENLDIASQTVWNKYPETRPVVVDGGKRRFLVWRKGCEKLQFETWNNTGWAYNNNDITHWALITPPNEKEEGK